jgi:tetratricopeptide (TPR) repeat protein
MFLNRFSSFAIGASVAIAVVVSSAPAFGAEAETLEQNLALLREIDADLAKKPGDVSLLLRHAQVMGHLERYEMQLSESRSLCLKYPKLREAKKSLASSLFGLKQFADALDALNQAFALGPPSSSELVQRAILLTELDRYSDALSDLNVVIKEHPTDEDAFFLRSECYFHLNGPCRQAVSDLEQTLKINPSRADARKLLTYMNKKIGAGTGGKL